MTAAYVQLAQNSTGNGSAPSPLTATFSSSTTGGNCLVVFSTTAGAVATEPVITVAASGGGTYQKIAALWDTSNDRWAEVGIIPNCPASTSITTTVTNSGSVGTPYFSTAAAEFSGLATSGTFTAGEFNCEFATPTSGTDTIVSGSTPTLSSANKLIIGLTSLQNALAGQSWLTAGTGYTACSPEFWNFSYSGNYFAAMEYKTVSSTTAVQATFSTTNAGQYMQTFVIALNLASGGATYNQSCSATTAMAATKSDQVSFHETLSPTTAMSPTLAKAFFKSFGAAGGAGVSLTKQVNKPLAAAGAAGVTLLKQVGKPLSAFGAAGVTIGRALSLHYAPSTAMLLTPGKLLPPRSFAAAGAASVSLTTAYIAKGSLPAYIFGWSISDPTQLETLLTFIYGNYFDKG